MIDIPNDIPKYQKKSQAKPPANYVPRVQPSSDWDMLEDDGAVLPF